MLSTDVGPAPAAPARAQESGPLPGGVARREPRSATQGDDFGEMVDRFADDSTPASGDRPAAGKAPRRAGLPQPLQTTGESTPVESRSVRGTSRTGDETVALAEPESETDEAWPEAAVGTVFDLRMVVATMLPAPPAEGGVQPAGPASVSTLVEGPATGVATPVAPQQRAVPADDQTIAIAVAPLAAQPNESADVSEFGLDVQPAVVGVAVDADLDLGAPAVEAAVAFAAQPRELAGSWDSVPAEAGTAPRWSIPPVDGPVKQWLDSIRSSPSTPAATQTVATLRQETLADIRAALAREIAATSLSGTPASSPTSDAVAPMPVEHGSAAVITETDPQLAPEAGALEAVITDARPASAASAATAATAFGHHGLQPHAQARVEASVPDAASVIPATAAVSTEASKVEASNAPVVETGVDRAGAARTSATQAQPHVVVPFAAASLSDEAVTGAATAGQGRKAGQQEQQAAPVTRPSARVAHAIAAFQAAALSGLSAGPTSAQPLTSGALPEALLDRELPTQIVQAIRVQFDQGSGEARMRLNPGFLGGMTVGVKVDGSSVVASLYSSNSEIRDWMQRNEQVLRQSLADQGLHLERLVIVEEEAQAPTDQERGSGQREQQEQEASRRPRRPAEQGTFELVL